MAEVKERQTNKKSEQENELFQTVSDLKDSRQLQCSSLTEASPLSWKMEQQHLHDFKYMTAPDCWNREEEEKQERAQRGKKNLNDYEFVEGDSLNIHPHHDGTVSYCEKHLIFV